MASAQITAAAAGTWTLGDLTVNRVGFGPHVLAIPGTADPGHLAENVAAGALRLAPDELTRLQSLGQAGGGG